METVKITITTDKSVNIKLTSKDGNSISQSGMNKLLTAVKGEVGYNAAAKETTT